VERATVSVGGEVVGSIAAGLCVLVGVTHDDTPAHGSRLADKLWKLRIFEDDDGKMNRPVADVGGGVLVVSQFTLYGDARKGNRPSFVAAARPEQAEPLIDHVVAELERHGATVATGRFRAEMSVELVNDGPVTLVIDV
jgi:D-tyrosyl-tRNA(Tyr) deacylase